MKPVHGVSCAALLLLLAAVPARAEEVYVCDDGRLVHVKADELEALKRTDRCIAKYFGLEIAAPPPAAVSAPPAAGQPPVTKWPLPQLKGMAADADSSASGPDGKLQLAGGPLIGGWQRIAEAGKSRSPGHGSGAASKPPAAAVSLTGDGYREVKILNAEGGEPAVYHHDR